MKRQITDWFNGDWASPEYQKTKEQNFNVLDSILSSPPTRILDIGCGLAWESRLFNKKYGTELWLLDGDADDNSQKNAKAQEKDWNNSADSFLFYTSLDKLNEQLQVLGTENYHLINASNINIPEDIKFDIITSWVSCGFHYPANTYKDLILKHSHNNTKIIFDIRTELKTNVPFLDNDTEIVNVLATYRKRITAEIRFKK